MLNTKKKSFDYGEKRFNFIIGFPIFSTKVFSMAVAAAYTAAPSRPPWGQRKGAAVSFGGKPNDVGWCCAWALTRAPRGGSRCAVARVRFLFWHQDFRRNRDPHRRPSRRLSLGNSATVTAGCSGASNDDVVAVDVRWRVPLVFAHDNSRRHRALHL
jgi:hypothetical protein